MTHKYGLLLPSSCFIPYCVILDCNISTVIYFDHGRSPIAAIMTISMHVIWAWYQGLWECITVDHAELLHLYWRSYRSAVLYVIEILFKHSNILFPLFIRHSGIVKNTCDTTHRWHGLTQIWDGNRIIWLSIWHRTTITTHFRCELIALCHAWLQLDNL